MKVALASLVLLLIPQISFAALKEINVALIFRYNDKFNGTTAFLDKGLELAKRDFEKSGKFKVRYTRYSHNEKLVTVIEATQKALLDGHQVIIGGENSDEAVAIAETAKGKNVVIITPTSTNPKVTAGRPYVFRTCVSDDKVADKLAQFVFSNEKPMSIGILHNVSYPYSDYLSKRFSQKIRELIDNSSTNQSQRPKVVERKIIRNQMDYSQEIKAFKEQGISHLILLSFQSDLLRFHSQAVHGGLNPIYIGSDGWGLNEGVQKQIIKDKKEGTIFVGLRNVYWNETSSSKANELFKTSFKSHFNQPANAWAAIAYDTATVLFKSFSSINGELNGEKLRNSLKSFKGRGLLTTENFTFDENNTPTQDVVIYRIDNKGIGFYGTI